MLSPSGRRPKPLTSSELQTLVVEALAKETFTYRECMVETVHAKFDHVERKIDINDVLHGLKTQWKSSRPDEFSDDFWQWKYIITTEDVDGEPLSLIIAVDSRNRSFEVVTRWSGEES